MKLTSELIREHEKIRKILIIMSKISEDLKVSKVFYPDDVEIVTKYVLNYWDKCHCKKEEKVLFPALVAEGVVSEIDNISFMAQEHFFGRNYLKEINSCVENCKIGNPFSVEMLTECLITYSEMISNHMDNEEKYFFPLADKVLSEEKQNQLFEKFEVIDKKIQKQNLLNEYRGKYDKLEKKYMKKLNLV